MKNINMAFLCAFLTACGGASSVDVEDGGVGSLPQTIIEPVDNPTTAEKVTLGKMLFWDPILSGDQDVACVSCHHPDNGYAENIDLSIGVGGHGLSEERDFGVLIKRNAPTIINTAYNGIDTDGEYDPTDTFMFWDNRSVSLEDQALGPIRSLEEMRGENFTEDEILDEVVNRLSLNAEYAALFADAFGDGTVTEERIAQAIAAFERSIIGFNSPFDRFARGDDSALTRQEIRGLNAFLDAGCAGCHNGPMFSDYELHQLPVATNEKLELEGIEDNGVDGRFRTPSLRNVALTAPYMHNGTVGTLRGAIEFYDNIANPGNDPDLAELDFEEMEPSTIAAMEAFLRTLTDESFDKSIPDSVPSGINPGGNI